MSTKLDVGKTAGFIAVRLVKGDLFTTTMRYQNSGMAKPWPDTPVLTLGNQIFPMMLSDDGSVAAVTIPAETVDQIIASGNKNAELNVGNVLTWRGKVFVS